MPIYCLEGTPGSGKTLYCVQKIIPEFLKIRDGEGNLVPRHIYTNIEGLKPWLICAWNDIPYENISEYFHFLGRCVDENGREYEDKDLVRYWFFKSETIEWVESINSNKQRERVPNWDKAEQIPVGSLVILDELQNYYGSRDFATTYSKRVIDYITKNRHYGWTLWWMSQSVESVDVTFRRNTQYVYFLERNENYGSSNSSSVKQYEGWLAGEKTNTPPFAKSTFKFDKRFFQAYKSYVKGVTEEKRYKTNVFLHHKGFLIMFILLLACVVFAFFHNPLKASKKVSKPSVKTPAVSVAPASARPVSASFSGTSGRAGVEPLENCAVNYFVVGGVPWVLLQSGEKKRLTAGAKYADCN